MDLCCADRIMTFNFRQYLAPNRHRSQIRTRSDERSSSTRLCSGLFSLSACGDISARDLLESLALSRSLCVFCCSVAVQAHTKRRIYSRIHHASNMQNAVQLNSFAEGAGEGDRGCTRCWHARPGPALANSVRVGPFIRLKNQ